MTMTPQDGRQAVVGLTHVVCARSSFSETSSAPTAMALLVLLQFLGSPRIDRSVRRARTSWVAWLRLQLRCTNALYGNVSLFFPSAVTVSLVVPNGQALRRRGRVATPRRPVFCRAPGHPGLRSGCHCGGRHVFSSTRTRVRLMRSTCSLAFTSVFFRLVATPWQKRASERETCDDDPRCALWDPTHLFDDTIQERTHKLKTM